MLIIKKYGMEYCISQVIFVVLLLQRERYFFKCKFFAESLETKTKF